MPVDGKTDGTPLVWDRPGMRQEDKVRKIVIIVGVLVLAFGTLTGLAAGGRWDGGDDLPADPLPCTSTIAPPTLRSVPYDGGQLAGSVNLSGQPLILVDIPVLIGVDYFNATARGMQEAADEIGNVEVINDGPLFADIEEQVRFINTFVGEGIDGVLFAANDPVAIAPALQQALDAGIHVIGYEGDSVPTAREWFIKQAEPNAIAKAMIDRLVTEQGEEAEFGIVTSSFSSPNQARWIAEMEAYAREVLPEAEVARDARGAGGRRAFLESGPSDAGDVR